MNSLVVFLSVYTFLIPLGSLAEGEVPLKKQGLSRAEIVSLASQNKKTAEGLKAFTQELGPSRPFSELEDSGYLFFSADTNFSSAEAKKILAQHLPPDVTLVVYTNPEEDVRYIRSVYEPLVTAKRLKIIGLKQAHRGFWARDGLPVPVWGKEAARLELVDAKYYHDFEPDQEVAEKFQAQLYSHDYYFEGGNFVTNPEGDCLSIDNSMSREIPLKVFQTLYGCKRVIRLEHLKGIGHADESVRFLDSKTVVTDTPEYVELLKRHGFQVLTIPRSSGRFESYINSLLINGTIYVPVYGRATDRLALDAYVSSGFKVVPIRSNQLSNMGQGSIHCITMTYPKVPFSALLDGLGAIEL